MNSLLHCIFKISFKLSDIKMLVSSFMNWRLWNLPHRVIAKMNQDDTCKSLVCSAHCKCAGSVNFPHEDGSGNDVLSKQ